MGRSPEDLIAPRRKGEISKDDQTKAIEEVVKRERDCKFHIKYITGYTPERHLLAWERQQHENTNRFWNFVFLIIGAVIGVASTIGAGLLVSLLTKTK